MSNELENVSADTTEPYVKHALERLQNWLGNQAEGIDSPFKPGQEVWIEMGPVANKMTVFHAQGEMIVAKTDSSYLVVHPTRVHTSRDAALEAVIEQYAVDLKNANAALDAMKAALAKARGEGVGK